MNNSVYDEMLPVGTVLKGCYEITERVGRHHIEQEYRAIDRDKGLECRIREFFLDGYMTRAQGEKDVQLQCGIRIRNHYENSKKFFVDKAWLMCSVQGKPNILSVYDVFCENNTAYYVYEAVNAVTLENYCRIRGCLDETEIKYITCQLCSALKELHKKSILHLNIVPQHILICSDKKAYENVKLIVNDECKLVDKDFYKGSQILMCMYPSYCAPETYGYVRETGLRTDIYMLGAVMYKMATSENPDEATNRCICDKMKSPHELNPQISKEFSDVIMRAMELKYQKRYRNEDRLMRAMGENYEINEMIGRTLL